MKQIKGIIPALLTPFDSNDDVNISALEELVEYNLAKGVTGFYVCGSTAEVFLLSVEERKEIMKKVSERVKGRCTLIAHIGCISTKHATELGKYALEYGYDLISSVAPFYYKFSFDEIRKYYFDIVNAVDLPMLIYNLPAFSGVTLSVNDIQEFFDDDRFVGIKHTSSDYYALERLKRAYPEKVILNGYDETFLAGLSMGADGAIGSTFNFMAEKFIKITELFNSGYIIEAREIQSIANTIISALCTVGVLQGEKEILNQLGLNLGKSRAPFKEISNKEKKYLHDVVMPLLCDQVMT